MYGNVGYFPFVILLMLAAIVVGALLVYWLIRLAVGGAMRDHRRWMQRQTEAQLAPKRASGAALPDESAGDHVA